MIFFRKLLWPFSFIYGLVTYIRNVCYDLGIFHVFTIPKKSICVGNLSTGGTGKTPHIAFLADYFSNKLETTILSRGYGRKTRGFILLNDNSTVNEVGDEPLFYSTVFSNSVHVAVCENRKKGVEEIQRLFPSNKLILLDDAFQHRAVKAGLNILLTDFNLPFSSDLVLPAGNLREWRIGKKRADLVIVTKCPDSLLESEKKRLVEKLKIEPAKVFFSKIKYGDFKSFGEKREGFKTILLVTGIANSTPLIDHLEKNFTVEHLNFKDHHVFSKTDILQIHQKFDTFVSDETILLTTEKDFMRLKENVSDWKLEEYPWYFQPITVEIDNDLHFKKIIDNYVNNI